MASIEGGNGAAFKDRRNDGHGERTSLRAALFVDFDNIFISFENIDPEACRRFATQPGRWLSWFERGMHTAQGGSEPIPRRILVRRCYLNPLQFGRFRGDFTRAAFSVVDCPPLTSRGKTSTDITMVMDSLDALDHPTRFDEFIILSSDADFTPVLFRLRAHDRRTTILCTDLAAAAYKAACDCIVPHDTFFTDALGLEEPGEQGLLGESQGPQASAEIEAVLLEVALALRDKVLAEGTVPGRDLPQLFQGFLEFKNSNWFGYYSLKALTARLIELTPEITFDGDLQGQWTLVLSQRGPRATARPTLAGAAMQGPSHHEPSRVEPTALDGASGRAIAQLAEPLARFITRIADLTGAPALAPEAYAILYRAIAVAVAETPGPQGDLARAVQTRCAEQGVTVTRSQASFLLTGLRYHGFALEGRNEGELAREWCRNVKILCESAQLELAPGDLAMLEQWLVPASPPPEEPTEPTPDGQAEDAAVRLGDGQEEEALLEASPSPPEGPSHAEL